MKKTLVIAFATLLSCQAFSQVKWGAQAIGNLSSASLPGVGFDEDGKVSRKSIMGYGFGLSAEVPLGREFTLRPSLNLLKKGGGLDASYSDSFFGSESVKFRTSLYYAELPIILAANGNMKGGKFYFGFGPSIGIGLSGKVKVNYTYQDPGMPVETESEEMDAFDSGSEEEGFKRFEFSGSLVAGLQWNNGLYVNAGYLAGFNNLFKEEAETTYKHRGIQLTVGYFFSKKK